MPWQSHCFLGSCNLPALCRECPGHGCFLSAKPVPHWLLLCRVMKEVGQPAGPGWALPVVSAPETVDTDHLAAEGSQGSVTGAITPGVPILA